MKPSQKMTALPSSTNPYPRPPTRSSIALIISRASLVPKQVVSAVIWPTRLCRCSMLLSITEVQPVHSSIPERFVDDEDCAHSRPSAPSGQLCQAGYREECYHCDRHARA
jgi:hypothetical protein